MSSESDPPTELLFVAFSLGALSLEADLRTIVKLGFRLGSFSAGARVVFSSDDFSSSVVCFFSSTGSGFLAIFFRALEFFCFEDFAR